MTMKSNDSWAKSLDEEIGDKYIIFRKKDEYSPIFLKEKNTDKVYEIRSAPYVRSKKSAKELQESPYEELKANQLDGCFKDGILCLIREEQE